jgi:hypothetical protein
MYALMALLLFVFFALGVCSGIALGGFIRELESEYFIEPLQKLWDTFLEYLGVGISYVFKKSAHAKEVLAPRFTRSKVIAPLFDI